MKRDWPALAGSWHRRAIRTLAGRVWPRRHSVWRVGIFALAMALAPEHFALMRMRSSVVVTIIVMVVIDILVLAWFVQRKGKVNGGASTQISQQSQKQSSSQRASRASADPVSGKAPRNETAAPDTLPAAETESASPQVIVHAGGEPGKSALVPLVLRLPDKAFLGTPKDLVLSGYVEPFPTEPRPPLLVPPGLTNMALGRLPTSSDRNASADTLLRVTDGDKGWNDEAIIFLRKGTQWLQLDLGEPVEMFAIVLWHAHNAAKVYHDVVVQTSDDPDFKSGVTTLLNNDQDNSSGLGAGTDREYFETNEGRLISAKGAAARYLRFYSKGSTESALNEYTEIEVYGRRAQDSGS